MNASRFRQAFRYLVKAARCFDPRPARRAARHAHPSHSEEELLARVDEYNRAAEAQWQVIAADPLGRAHELNKPFSTVRDTPAILSHVGLSLDALDLGLGHTVLDLGAGACWLSLALNRLGCRTISMDVSPTALSIGEEGFRREPATRAELEPQFVPYDGHRIPLEDGSVDRAICFDAFHHVPNQDEMLAELFRVLKPGGRLVMAEPGEGHASTGHSRFETEHYGVLENDLSLADLLARARRAGFGPVLAKPYPDPRAITIEADDYLRLVDGDHSVFPMHILQDHLRATHLLILLKGASRHDSRNPAELLARITPLEPGPVAGDANASVELPVRIENLGDTLWLSTVDPVGGFVSLGGHLFDDGGRLLRRGHFTCALPRDMAPGETVEYVAHLQLPDRPGRFRLVLDLVDHHVAWFEQCGSTTTPVELAVSDWPDSRAPHCLAARIEVLEGRPQGPVPAGGGLPMRVRATNTGDTRWVAGPESERGSVTLGVQVRTPDGTTLEVDHFRATLTQDVDPGSATEMMVTVPAPARPGRYQLALDMVCEQICWFAHHGGAPTVVDVETWLPA